MKWLLKHCGTLIPPQASEQALSIAKTHNIDLFALQWKDQPKAEELITKKKGRGVFVHEHERPVIMLYNQILVAKTLEEVQSVLERQSIVWITGKENKRLPKFKRDEHTYKKAKIVKRLNPYKDEWMEYPWNLNDK